MTLATALLNDKNAAEDVVHDVFVSFIESAEKLRLTGRIWSRVFLNTADDILLLYRISGQW